MDAVTGRRLLTLGAGRSNSFACVAFSPDGKRIVAGREDYQQEVTTGRRKTVKKYGESVVVWDATTGREVLRFASTRSLAYPPYDENAVHPLAYSPDGRRIVTAGNTLTVWDAATGRRLSMVKPQKGYYAWVNFSRDGRQIAVQTNLDTVQHNYETAVYDIANGRRVFSLGEGRMMPVYSPDGRYIATRSLNDVTIFEAEKGQKLFTIKGGTDEVAAFTFVPNGTRLATITTVTTLLHPKGSVIISEAEANSEGLTLGKKAAGFAVSPDSQRVATTGNYLNVWDIAAGRRLFTNSLGEDFARLVAYSPDGGKIATAGKHITVWDAHTGQKLLTFLPQARDNSEERLLAFSQDGQQLVTGYSDFGTGYRDIKVWNASDGSLLFTHPHEDGSYFVSRKGQLYKAMSKEIRVSDVVTGKKLRSIPLYETDVVLYSHDTTLSPDDKYIAAATYNNVQQISSVGVLDAVTGRRLLTLGNFLTKESFLAVDSIGGIKDVGYSPDGKRIYTAVDEENVRLWDAATGEQLLSFESSRAPVVFSPDGTHIVMKGADETIKVYTAASDEEVRAYERN